MSSLRAKSSHKVDRRRPGILGAGALILAIIMSAVIGIMVLVMHRRDDTYVSEYRLIRESDRDSNATESMTTLLRMLIATGKISVATPTTFSAKGPLPYGWSVANGKVIANSCLHKSFDPDKADQIFGPQGASPASLCDEQKPSYTIEATGFELPGTLFVTLTERALKGRFGERVYKSSARLSVSGCTGPSTRKTASFSVVLGPTLPPCLFGIPPNLPAINGFVTARKERTYPLTQLPPAAEICSLTMESVPGPLSYDDGLFLTLNDAVLMASHLNLYWHFPMMTQGFRRFDWPALRGKSYLTNDNIPTCLDAGKPGAQCFVPPTESSGQIRLKFLDSSIQKVSRWAASKGEPLALKLVVTGDDNPEKDCRTSPIVMNVTATYAAP